MAEVADGVAFVPSFANVVRHATGDGLVLVDSGQRFVAGRSTARCGPGPPIRLNTAVYSHGHIDHVFGVGGVGGGVAEARGWPAPVVVAHEAVPARFDRYIMTAGYNEVINHRQFGSTRPAVAHRDTATPTAPTAPARPRRRRGAGSSSTTPGVRPTTTPGPGSRPAACCAAATCSSGRHPTPATPRRCSAIPLEWAVALRRMMTLFEPRGRARGPAARARLPRHGGGPRPTGPHRHRRAPRVPRRPDPRAHERRGPARRGPPHRDRPRPPAGPSLPAARLRRARVRGAQRVAPVRRMVGREPGLAQAGTRGPWPASWPPWPAAPGSWPTGPWPWWRPAPTGPADPVRQLRLAGHLAELGLAGRPRRPRRPPGPAEVFTRLSETATSTMAKGVFTWAARESERTGRPTLRRGSRRLIPKAPTRDFACPAGVGRSTTNSRSRSLVSSP